ncbi:hypothetical protein JHK82_049816 [Glycine max]|nr:hypothetical protein JHK86_049689 [Glycine max]KAG4935519.1 hypothetical protein JHK85_050438 [Glycine max]KAG5091038.1 hypothetical protein JHK82_049816 [Glycine max]
MEPELGPKLGNQLGTQTDYVKEMKNVSQNPGTNDGRAYVTKGKSSRSYA